MFSLHCKVESVNSTVRAKILRSPYKNMWCKCKFKCMYSHMTYCFLGEICVHNTLLVNAGRYSLVNSRLDNYFVYSFYNFHFTRNNGISHGLL